jgi:hypothetical protein
VSYFEDYIEAQLIENFYWETHVEDSLEFWSNDELLQGASKTLQTFPGEKRMHEDYNIIRSILIYGIGYRKLSDKQRFVLLRFIMENE